MAQDHSHAHQHEPSDNVGIVFFLNLGFTLIEIVGSFFTNSFAILADAIHDLGDTLSLGLAWYFQRLSRRGRSPQFTFGYKRFNTLGAVITGMVLVGGSVFIHSSETWADDKNHGLDPIKRGRARGDCRRSPGSIAGSGSAPNRAGLGLW